jgi:hypothetical protein
VRKEGEKREKRARRETETEEREKRGRREGEEREKRGRREGEESKKRARREQEEKQKRARRETEERQKRDRREMHRYQKSSLPFLLVLSCSDVYNNCKLFTMDNSSRGVVAPVVAPVAVPAYNRRSNRSIEVCHTLKVLPMYCTSSGGINGPRWQWEMARSNV